MKLLSENQESLTIVLAWIGIWLITPGYTITLVMTLSIGLTAICVAVLMLVNDSSNVSKWVQASVSLAVLVSPFFDIWALHGDLWGKWHGHYLLDEPHFH